MLQNHAKAETEKAEKFMINAQSYARRRDRESRTSYGQRTMQRLEMEKAEQVMVNASELIQR